MRSLTQRGFSLVEVLVSAAILGGTTLLTMKLVEDQETNRVQLERTAAVRKTMALVRSTIANHCRYNLAGKNFGSVELDQIAQPFRDTGAEKVIISRATNYDQFAVRKIALQESNTANRLPPGTAEIYVEYVTGKHNKDSWGIIKKLGWTNEEDEIRRSEGRFYLQQIPIRVSVNSAGEITDCGTLVSETNLAAKEKFCRSLGTMAGWADSGACALPNTNQCPSGQVINKITNLGTLECVDLKDKLDLTKLVNTEECTYNGSLAIVSDGAGKLKLSCGSSPVPPSPPSPPPPIPPAPTPEAPCSLPWGGTIPSGSSVTAYTSTCGPCDANSETRNCFDGTLSGSYQYPSCTITSPPPTPPGCVAGFVETRRCTQWTARTYRNTCGTGGYDTIVVTATKENSKDSGLVDGIYYDPLDSDYPGSAWINPQVVEYTCTGTTFDCRPESEGWYSEMSYNVPAPYYCQINSNCHLPPCNCSSPESCP